MKTPAQHLTDLVAQARDAAGHADSPVPLEPCVPCGNPDHGDYQSNFAFRLGKALRTNPRQVAQAIVDALPDDPAIGSADVAGPGFINFRLANAWLAGDLKARTGHEGYGAQQPGAGKTLIIDYSSPNIAKRMHVGHLRSTVIGNALHRMYRYLGWEVIADNHVGDWGTQFGALIYAWNTWRDEDAYDADPIGELQRIYQLFGEKKKDDPELIEAARAETARLQAGDAENLNLWRQFVDVSMLEFNALYERLGVHFDVVHGESFYREGLQELIDGLMEDGIAEPSEGAVIVPFESSDGKGLAKNPLLIRKSDGAALYGTTDLATVRHRMETWSPERVVYVTDVRQQLHFRQVFAACRKMGITDPELIHVWFGILTFPGGVIASTRSGNVINLVDLLDTAADKAFSVVTEKSPQIPEVERKEIAEAVGTGTIKYFDLSQNPQSNITFTWDSALSLEGNTAVYLMYAYARLHSILRKGGFEHAEVDALPALDHPAERTLGLLAARTPEAIEVAAEQYKPSWLAEHLYTVAKAVGPFYDQCPVLKDDVDPDLRTRRLALVAAVTESLSTGMKLLGLRPIERM